MSSTLYYRPVHKADKSLPDELKFAMKKLDEFGQSVDGTYDDAFIPVLRGMEAGGVKGAKQLINTIEKYGEVELKEEY